MAIITISRGSYSNGKAVAEKVAERLGYECISRDIILEASEEFNVPEIKLVRAIHDAPGIFERLSHNKNRYVSYIQMALLKHFSKDNIVYHGLAGHYFVQGLSHVLKVRIIADMEQRVELEMKREKISRKKALQLLKKDDEERKKWSHYLYNTDPTEPRLYDMVLRVHRLSVDYAAKMICHSAKLESFQTTRESQKAMGDLLIAAEVKAAIVDIDQDAKVTAKDGVVDILSKAKVLAISSLSLDIEKITKTVPGVKEVRVNIEPIVSLTE